MKNKYLYVLGEVITTVSLGMMVAGVTLVCIGLLTSKSKTQQDECPK
jgi:hypothetical protein